MRILIRASGNTSVDSTSMMVQDTSSSMSVNPRWFLRFMPRLPFRIRLAIAVVVLRLGVNVKNVVAAPRLRLDVVLHTAHAPLLGVGKRIPRDAPQKLHFLPVGRRRLHAFHQNVQRFGIAETALFDRAEGPQIASVLV